jgi:hypothetical protein
VVNAAVTTPSVRTPRQGRAPDAVVEWRFDELERAGLDALDALRLALDPVFDVAALRRLVGRGCDAALAARIVA